MGDTIFYASDQSWIYVFHWIFSHISYHVNYLEYDNLVANEEIEDKLPQISAQRSESVFYRLEKQP